ncbi:serine/threonine-protein kinase [Actinomadura madurae]|uniref:serine/threonine-protein kinase n=1 Tax=Actinomadura madurae TaxID=1993 RepID=UPI0020D20A3F|nr:serine/threonine-protein kinase [Actinomadura madurae]MCQ0007505.1 serine/threonine protein kinase [Actinomadura madurae]
MAGAGLGSLKATDPARIGPYRLLARLGAGGMGQVYLGRSPGRRLVAVKVVHPHFADNTVFRRRFTKEVAAARRIGGFYTAQVIDADPDADPPWLATEYIAGPSLHAAIDTNGALPEVSVAALGAGLAEGLLAVHDQNVIHRDLKPGNVLLAQDGPRIIDFGIARATDATSQSITMVGTPGYMSPEQYLGGDVGTARRRVLPGGRAGLRGDRPSPVRGGAARRPRVPRPARGTGSDGRAGVVTASRRGRVGEGPRRPPAGPGVPGAVLGAVGGRGHDPAREVQPDDRHARRRDRGLRQGHGRRAEEAPQAGFSAAAVR